MSCRFASTVLLFIALFEKAVRGPELILKPPNARKRLDLCFEAVIMLVKLLQKRAADTAIISQKRAVAYPK